MRKISLITRTFLSPPTFSGLRDLKYFSSSFAYEFGFNQIFVEDAMAARSKDEHNYPLKYIFPRLGLIRSTDQVIKAFN